MWFRNSSGKKDAMLTFAVLSWFVTVFCLVVPMFNGFVLPWGNYTIHVMTPDTSLVVALLGAGFTSYVLRRNKKDQLESDAVLNVLNQ